MAARMAARSTTAGTPVKSCSSTRAGKNGTRLPSPGAAGQPASASTSSSRTCSPPALRSSPSSRMRTVWGSRCVSAAPLSSSRLIRNRSGIPGRLALAPNTSLPILWTLSPRVPGAVRLVSRRGWPGRRGSCRSARSARRGPRPRTGAPGRSGISAASHSPCAYGTMRSWRPCQTATGDRDAREARSPSPVRTRGRRRASRRRHSRRRRGTPNASSSAKVPVTAALSTLESRPPMPSAKLGARDVRGDLRSAGCRRASSASTPASVAVNSSTLD